jgi:excisionase family DNA binding protein
MQHTNNSAVFLTVRELANATHLSESTIWRHIGTGQISSVKIGGARRVPLAYLEQLATVKRRPSTSKRKPSRVRSRGCQGR